MGETVTLPYRPDRNNFKNAMTKWLSPDDMSSEFLVLLRLNISIYFISFIVTYIPLNMVFKPCMSVDRNHKMKYFFVCCTRCMYSYKGICDDVIHKDIKEITFIDESGHYWTMTLQIGDDLKHIYFGGRWKNLRNARGDDHCVWDSWFFFFFFFFLRELMIWFIKDVFMLSLVDEFVIRFKLNLISSVLSFVRYFFYVMDHGCVFFEL
jgi:hypothetical protein